MSGQPEITPTPGALMASEAAEAARVFCQTAGAGNSLVAELETFASRKTIFTVARGSSDAAANIISYEMMRETGIPATSMPPSVFSLGSGVRLDNSGVLVISQSGASGDLVRSAARAKELGASVVAITNRPGSRVEAAVDVTLPISAGPELAVPATKSVIGSIAAGMRLIAVCAPGYAERCAQSAKAFATLDGAQHPAAKALSAALLGSQHVYVIGRDTGYGAAQEIALKLKECCAQHAEAYSSSEVLHGPLQLVTKPLIILMLDTESAHIQPSMDTAEARFRSAGGRVFRIRPSDVGVAGLTPAAAAAALLHLLYPVILSVALSLGLDPDRPETLAKETLTL